MKFQLRSATVTDLDSIMAIDSASFKRPWARSSFATALADVRRSVVLVMEVGGEVRAYGVAWNIGEEGEIATLAVDVTERGRGLGCALVQALIHQLWEGGARHVFLEVRPSNMGAVRLYERLNFTEVGRRPNYYFDGESAIIMKLQLDD